MAKYFCGLSPLWIHHKIDPKKLSSTRGLSQICILYFGYRSESKAEIFNNPLVFWRYVVGTYRLNNGEFRVFFPLILWLATWALFFPPEKSAFYHSLFVARRRKLANPTPPKKTLGEAQPSFYWRDSAKK